MSPWRTEPLAPPPVKNHCAVARVPSLVGELSSHKPCHTFRKKKKKSHCSNHHAGLLSISRVTWPNQNSPKPVPPAGFPSQQMIPPLGRVPKLQTSTSSDLLSFTPSPSPSNLLASLISSTPKMGARSIVPSSSSKPPSLFPGTPSSTSSSQVPLLSPLLPLESSPHGAA